MRRGTRGKHSKLNRASRAPSSRTKPRKPSKSSRKTEKRVSVASKNMVRKPRSPRLSSLTARERDSRARSLALLSDLRRGKGTYDELLRVHHLHRRTARKHLGRDLQGGNRGQRVRPSKADSRVRELLFPSSSGDVPVRIRGSKAATKLSEFFHDRDELLRDKLSADDFEAKWRGVRIAGQEVFADAASLFLRAEAGDLKVENLYASVGGVE
jgi:hypothetical protein